MPLLPADAAPPAAGVRSRLPVLGVGVVAALILLLVAGVAAAADPALTLNQPNPVYGDTVTFTGTYPSEARRKVGKQQAVNPNVDVGCYQNNIRVFHQITSFPDERSNGDGTWTGTTGQVALAGWDGQPAHCYGTLYYFYKDGSPHGGLILTVVATTEFDVGAAQ